MKTVIDALLIFAMTVGALTMPIAWWGSLFRKVHVADADSAMLTGLALIVFSCILMGACALFYCFPLSS